MITLHCANSADWLEVSAFTCLIRECGALGGADEGSGDVQQIGHKRIYRNTLL